MFVYCRNNPVNRKDNNGAEDEDATDEEDDGYRLVGFGFQGELDVGSYEVGVEIIVYWDQLVCGGKDPIVAIYSYEGVYVDIDDIKKSTQYIETVSKLILAGGTNFSDNQNIEALLIALQQSIFKDLGVSGSVMGILGNSDFKNTESYSGAFDTYSATVNHVKFTYSTSPSCKVIAVGGSTDRWGGSFGQSYYTQLY